MNLIKGIEALLYECLSWLVFYPLTMWRVLTRPITMMRYAETEITTVTADGPRFDDSMSPPIFLVVTLFLALALQRSSGDEVLAGPLGDTQNMLAFRAIVFGLFPLLLALVSVRMRKVTLTRQSMQPAFYAQCFVAGPAILATGVTMPLVRQGELGLWGGIAVAVLGLGWYFVVQLRWMRLAGASWVRAVLTVLGASAAALVLGIVLFSIAKVAVAAF